MGNPDDESWRQRLTVYCIRFAITDLLFAFYAFMARKVFLSCSYVTEHHAFQNTYLLTFTIDIIDCWKLTSLIIALQMVFVSKRLNEAGFLSSFYLLIWLVVTCSLIFGAKIQIKLPGHPFLASLVRLKNETFWVNFYTLIIRVPYFLQIRVGWILHIFFCKFKVCFVKISFSQKKMEWRAFVGPKVIQEAKADSVVQSSTSLFFDWVLPVVLFLVFSFPFFFSAWELVVALACFTAGVTTTELCSLLLPSIKARRAFGPVLVAFTVSEKRPTKVCETRELRYCYMTKLCLCVYVRLSPLLPTLEFRNLFSKQGEKNFFVSII